MESETLNKEQPNEVSDQRPQDLQPSQGAAVLSRGGIVALIGSMLLVGTSFGAVAPLVSAILENRGFSEYFTGGVSAMLALAIAICSSSVGRLVERFGMRRINNIGILGQAIGFAGLGLALATNEVLLFPIRFWLGASATMTFVAAEVALLRGVQTGTRGRVMAAYGSALAVGFMLGVFASEVAYQKAGLWSFGMVAIAAIVIAPLAWLGMRGPAGDPMPKLAMVTHSSESPKPTLPWRLIWLGLFGAVIFGGLDTAISGTYPVEGQRLGLTRSETLNIVGLMALGMVISQPICGWLSDKFGARVVLTFVSAFGIGSCVLAGLVSQNVQQGNKEWIGMAFLGIGVAVGGCYPVCLKILGDRTPPDKLPIANARFSTLYGYASLAGPMVAAFGIDVLEHHGFLGWAVPGLSGLLMAFLLPFIIWDRSLEHSLNFKLWR